MKKLELKNLKVVKLSKSETIKVQGGKVPSTSGPCNATSFWPVDCNGGCQHCTGVN